jgi:hypothetical protein
MKNGFILCGEVVANDSDQIHVSKETGGDREISRGATNDAIDLSIRAFNGVKCHGTYDEQRHSFSLPGAGLMSGTLLRGIRRGKQSGNRAAAFQKATRTYIC